MLTPDDQSQLLSLALKGSNSGIWDWDMSDDSVFFDPNYYQMAGYEPNEFPHKFEEWERRVHPDDLLPARKAVQQYLAGKIGTYSAEFRFKTKSGDWMWILAKGEVTGRDENGNPTRFSGLHVDISQIKNTEQTLQKERAFSTSLINTAKLIILVMDVEGRIQKINPYMEAITGYKEAEVKGKDWFDTFLPPADHTELRAMFKKAIADIDVSGEANPIMTKDGRELMIEWHSKTLKDTDGAIVGLLSFGVDIAARIKAEQALRKSEEKFRLSFKTSPDSINLNRLEDGVYLEINDGFTNLTGYTAAEVIGVSSFDLNIWKNEEARAELTKDLAEHTYAENVEAEFVTKNGDIKNGLMSARVFEIEGEKVILSIVRDITERKLVEEKFQTLVKESSVGIALADVISGEILECNPALERMLGYGRGELLGQHQRVIDDGPGAEPSLTETFIRHTGEDSGKSLFRSCVTKDGRDLDVEIKSTRFTLGNRDVILGFFQDITERKKAEDDLYEAHAILQVAMNSSPAGIAIADAPDGKLRYFNDAGLLICGGDRATIANGIGLDQYVAKLQILDLDGHPLETDEMPLARAVIYGEESGRDFIVRDVKGADHIVSAKASPIKDRNGKTVAGIAVFHDISEKHKAEVERRELERQLHQKNKMEAIGVLAGGMAHNFNNNLSIILGNLELATLNLPPQSDIAEFIDHAKLAVLSSRDLVKQIMTYSRKGEQQKVPLQLSATIAEVIAMLKSTIPSSIYLQQNLHPDSIPAYIRANASQLQEVLLNLCNNAVHAMEKQGKLTIALAAVELTRQQIPANSQCQPGYYLRLSVQDTGCGITPEIMDKIFDPFFTTKEVHEGTGMGLSTVQGVMEQLQGQVTVESHIGQGTTFHLDFPVIEVTAEDDHHLTPSALPRGTEHILFVDDDEMLASVVHRMLTEMGYQVTLMTDSQDALKLFTAHADSFQLVITDQTMPGLTGKEFIQKLKQIRPETPTIICTGYSSKVDEEVARDLGAHAFLIKPLAMLELSQTVRRVLDGERE